MVMMNMKLFSMLDTVCFAVIVTATTSLVGADETDKNCIQLCGCPTVSACPNLCGNFELGKCQPFYQCFLPENGLFAYVVPQGNFSSGNNITVHVYDDAACTQLRFPDPALVGWEGSCDSTCWGPSSSKIGAQACGVECSSSSSSSLNTASLWAMLASTVMLLVYLCHALPDA